LETALTQKGSTEYRYKAISPGFSEFAISAEQTTETTSVVEEEVVDTNTSETEDTEIITLQVGEDSGIMDWKLLLGIVVLIAILAGAGLHYYFNVYRKY